MDGFKYTMLQGSAISSGLSYEDFLLEVINWPLGWFMSKSGGERFQKPANESHGECDAVTKSYSIDFKLLVDSREMNSRRKARPFTDYSHMGEGYITVKDNAEAGPVDHHNIMQELVSIDDEAYRAAAYSDSVRSLIANTKKKKNLLFYYPYEFGELPTTLFARLGSMLEKPLARLLNEREAQLPEFETYLCIKVGIWFVIYQWENDHFVYRDAVSEAVCPTYRDLKAYSFD